MRGEADRGRGRVRGISRGTRMDNLRKLWLGWEWSHSGSGCVPMMELRHRALLWKTCIGHPIEAVG
jgi:hypothetical protein